MPHSRFPSVEQAFISYSRDDLEAAIALKSTLERSGVSVFRDEDSIRVGDNWMSRLDTALQGCSAFLLLVGKRGVQRWVMAETQIALVRHFSPHDELQRLPIFPVLLPEGDLHSLPVFLSLIQTHQWSPDQPISESLISAIKNKTGLMSVVIDFKGCPYLGLSAFQSQDAGLFFGRQQETLKALNFFGSQREDSHPDQLYIHSQYHRWLQVQGNSGSGKSSLVNAGLIPMIEQGALWARTGYEHWQIIGPLMPGKHPLRALAEVMQHALISESGQRNLQAFYKCLKEDDTALSMWLRNFKKADTAFLLVVDQFEELFTFAEQQERLCFDRQLATALCDEGCSLFLISTVRIDFLEHFEQLPLLSELENSDLCKRYALKTISNDGLREVIEQPARLAGLDVSSVTTAILQDAQDEPGALPLVENALRVLWNEREGQCLSGELYQQKGGIAGLLEEQADALLKRMEQDFGAKTDALELLFQLTQVNEDGRHTRRRLPLGEARRWAGGDKANEQLGQKVIDYLTGQVADNGGRQHQGSLRLLSTVGEDKTEQSIDLIHETLIRTRGADKATGKSYGYWKTLYDYIEANRGRSFYRDQLERRAKEWYGSQGFFKRWRKLAGWKELRGYRKLRLEKGGQEERFIRRSRIAGLLQGGGIAVLLASVVESYLWTLNHELPPSYMIQQQKFRLYDFGLFNPPLPEIVKITLPPTSSDIWIGELNAQVGEELNQKLKPGGYSQKNIGYPPVSVNIPGEYAMGKYEITYQQYDYFVWKSQKNGTAINYPGSPPNGIKRGLLAVVNVSALDAKKYLAWLSGVTGDEYRLPTEAEWEYAARGGTTDPYPWGGEMKPNMTNCHSCGSKWDGKKVAPVGSFEPNKFGLYDVIGNVWEWTCSEWEVEYGVGSESKCEDDPLPNKGYALRGGSYLDGAEYIRVSYRSKASKNTQRPAFGFRVLRVSRTR